MKPSAHFSASLMSDAKWRKFFRVAADHAGHVFMATWKLIGDSEPVAGRLPLATNIWDTAVDGCLNGPVDYEQIEWVEIPRNVPYRQYESAPLTDRFQALEAFRSALASVGEFPIVETEVGLRINGYIQQTA